VLTAVRERGQEENTLIFFIADNGGPTQGTTSQNGPLRGFKTNTYEGGPRVPFLVQWKGRLPAGRTYDLPVMNLDVAPTILASAGKPIDAAEKLDGVDLVPFLTGKATGRPHETMFWRFGDQWAVRNGDWKLVVSEPTVRDADKGVKRQRKAARRGSGPRRSRPGAESQTAEVAS
jgi:arylsulfatase A-like enzyme